MVILVIQAIGMFVWRKHPTISNASIGCLTILMIGASLMAISTIMWSLVQTPGLCAIKWILACIGSQMILGALLMRTYRIGIDHTVTRWCTTANNPHHMI